ncbi:hypothetical protein AHAS_Ahas16G0280700 [Arachis hypogaea]
MLNFEGQLGSQERQGKETKKERIKGERQAGKYKWQTYKEVYEVIQKVGSSIHSCGYGQGMKCGIYGANCPGWIISMEACNAHGLYYVPLYDTLGAGAVEFIICHAEISIAFVEEKKIPELLKTFPNASKFLKTLVSFEKFTPEQKQQVENFGVKSYSWDEFLQVLSQVILGNDSKEESTSNLTGDVGKDFAHT